MARMPGVDQRSTPNCSYGVVRPARGIVCHIAVGSYDGTINWQQMPESQVSSHFIVARDGRICQMVDTDQKAWAEAAGNPYWISIEHEGTDGFSDEQVAADARIYAWLVSSGIAILGGPTQDPNGIGICPHSAGGQAWGGHIYCPGANAQARFGDIYNQTVAILHPPPPPPPPRPKQVSRMLLAPYGKSGYVTADPFANPNCVIVYGGKMQEPATLSDTKNNNYVYTFPGPVVGLANGLNADGSDARGTVLVSWHGDGGSPAHLHWV